MHYRTLISLATLAAAANAHFVLQVPTSLGFDDDKEGQGSCGSFDTSDRSKGVASFPLGGAPVQLLTTHIAVTWDINAALLSDTKRFSPLLPTIAQRGVGTFCLPAVPGKANWSGKDAVLQIVQHGPDGDLFQCAAVKFTSGEPADVPSSCSNSTGIIASFVGGSAPSSAAVAQPTVVPLASPPAVGASSSASVGSSTVASTSETPVQNNTSAAQLASPTSAAPAKYTGIANRILPGSFAIAAGFLPGLYGRFLGLSYIMLVFIINILHRTFEMYL